MKLRTIIVNNCNECPYYRNKNSASFCKLIENDTDDGILEERYGDGIDDNCPLRKLWILLKIPKHKT